MVVLHIASIKGNMSSGVCVIVPQHVKYQAERVTAGLVNIQNVEVPGVVQLKYEGAENFPAYLPEPFNKPDLVVFHEVNCFEYIHIYKKLKKAHIAYIIFPHGSLTKQALKKKWLKKKIAYTLFFNAFIKNAAAIQTLSQNECDNIKFKVKKFIGTNGVRLPEKNKQKFSSEGIKFVYIGRLDAYVKGLDLMLEAISKTSALLRENKCEFKLYGPDLNGRFQHVLDLIKENNVSDLVTLSREIYGKDKEEALLDADIFIQTSRTEGMPLGILEALSYGIPCLVTQGTSLGEVISGNNAGWAAQTSADGISKALVEAIGDKPKYKIKSENAKKLIEAEFQWDKIVAKTLEDYQKYV